MFLGTASCITAEVDHKDGCQRDPRRPLLLFTRSAVLELSKVRAFHPQTREKSVYRVVAQ
jgi:hypothetical protein